MKNLYLGNFYYRSILKWFGKDHNHFVVHEVFDWPISQDFEVSGVHEEQGSSYLLALHFLYSDQKMRDSSSIASYCDTSSPLNLLVSIF